MKKKYIYLLLIKCILFQLTFVVCQLNIQIPTYLEECYINDTYYKYQIPLNLQNFLDIIRKIETFSQSTMNLRILTSTILHRFKFDGVELHKNLSFKPGILPFSGTGSQRAKNEIISEMITGDAKIFPDQALSLAERCALHRALSNSISDAKSPSTDEFCTERITEKILDNSEKKEKICPTEQGIILTPTGTVSPSAIIAAIAAVLQHQTVPVKLMFNELVPSLDQLHHDKESNEFNEEDVDFIVPRSQIPPNKLMWFNSLISSTAEVDSVWLATIAGELAELVVYQGPIMSSEMTLGSAGFWNNTIRPHVFYLIQKDDYFDVTRAEIVGSIDGFIIAQNLKKWLSQIGNLRLSQIFDMYYSSRGMLFDSLSACRRRKNFWYIASKTIMEEQVFSTSQVLAYRRSVAHMTDEALKIISSYAVNIFTKYVNNHLFSELRCIDDKIYPRVEAFVIFDGAWSRGYTANFLAALLEDLNVSKFGSKIGFLHGTSGELLLNTTDSPSTIHTFVISRLNSLDWPTNLNFTKNIQNINKYFTERWGDKSINHTNGSLNSAIIFLAPTGINDKIEHAEFITELKEFRQHHPDANIVYYTNDEYSRGFQPFLLTEQDHLIDTLKISDITKKLLFASRSLKPNLCNQNSVKIREQVEEYVKPQETLIYKLHSHWRKKTKNVAVSIVSFAYGSIEICSWSQMRNGIIQNNYYCKELSGHAETKLMDFFDCQENVNCPDIFYRIRGISSLKKCAEIDCKSPDYIRFLLRIENSTCSNAVILSANVFITVILFVLQFFIYVKSFFT